MYIVLWLHQIIVIYLHTEQPRLPNEQSDERLQLVSEEQNSLFTATTQG